MPLAARGTFTAIVAANVPLCREHHRLTLRLDRFPPTEPGQFVQVACADPPDADAEPRSWDASTGQWPDVADADLLERRATLRRPFSLAGRRDLDDGGVEIDLIHRTVGAGTDWLARLTVGHGVSILGPLGNRFAPPASDGIALFVGGGVGIPPMLYLAQRWAGRRAVAFAGALSRDLLPLTITPDAPPPAHAGDVDPLYNIAEFARHGTPAVIATDDGSYGYRGFVTQALERYLDRWFPSAAAPGGFAAGSPRPTIYTCGPEPMMRRVADLAAARGLACQVAVERAMACGMGTCQSCVIKVRKPDPAAPPLAGSSWCYRLACTDGPVFAAAELLW
jgi:dihydroorotate dehydrogenase electron transfer subunit